MTVDKEAIHRARIIWESRNPQHETNSDTGEDMFWRTMTMCMQDFSASLLKENEALKEEIAGLNRVISQMFADKVSETRELQSSNEKLKIERDKFEGGDELKSKKIIELEAWKESAMNIMSPMQEIGKAIGVKLGHSIHDKILPAIIVLKSSDEAKDRECEYWKARCEAAEVVLDTFPREVLLDQAGEDYHEYEQLKQKLPQRVIE